MAPPEQIGKGFRMKNQHTDDVFDVGDPAAAEFVPRMHMRKWGGECDFKIVYDDKHISASKKSVSVNGDKVHWKSPEIELRYYPTEPRTYIMRHPQRISDAPFPEPNGENGLLVADIPFSQNDQGGLELEIILNTKPQNNTLSFDFETKQLKWYAQPSLHPDHPTWSDDNGDGEADNFRPENCVDSIVAFHATRGNFHEGIATAQKYKCGIAFTIYRPKAVDANGAETWCTQELKNNKYSITVPQAFLDAAAYPVTIDPSFGTTSVGGSTVTIEDSMKASLFTTPAFAIDIIQIDSYVTVTSIAKNVNNCVYLHSDLSKKVQGVSTSQPVAAGWALRPVTPYTLAASTDYLLTAWSFLAATNGLISYTAGAANQGHTNALAYNAVFPTPFVVTAHTTNNCSIFATYLRFIEPMPFVDKLTQTHVKLGLNRTITEVMYPVESRYGGSNKTLVHMYSSLLTDPMSFVDGPRAQTVAYKLLDLVDPLPFIDQWVSPVDKWVKTLSQTLKEPTSFADVFTKAGVFSYSQIFNDPLPFIDAIKGWLKWASYAKVFNEPLPLIEATAGTTIIDVYAKTLSEPIELIDRLGRNLQLAYSQGLKDVFSFVDKLTRSPQLTYSQALKDPLQFVDKITETILVSYTRSVFEPIELVDKLTRATALTYSQALKDVMPFIDKLAKSTALAYSRLLTDPIPFLDIFTRETAQVYSRTILDPIMLLFSGAYTETMTWAVKTFNEPMPFVDLMTTNLKVPAFLQILKEPLPLVDVLTRSPQLTYSQMFNEPSPFVDFLARTVVTAYERATVETLMLIDILTRSHAYTFSQTLVDPLPLIDFLFRNAQLTYSRMLKDPTPLVDVLSKSGVFMYSRLFKEPSPLIDMLIHAAALTYSRALLEPLQLVDFLTKEEIFLYTRVFPETATFIDTLAREISRTFMQLFTEPTPFIDLLNKATASVYSQVFKDPMSLIDLLFREISVTYLQQMLDPLSFADLLAHATALIYSQVLFDPMPFVDHLTKFAPFIFRESWVEALPFVDILTKTGAFAYSQFTLDPLMLIDVLTATAVGVFYAKTLTEALAFIDRLTATYFEGCLDYDYMVNVFNELAKLAGGKSIARELERKDP